MKKYRSYRLLFSLSYSLINTCYGTEAEKSSELLPPTSSPSLLHQPDTIIDKIADYLPPIARARFFEVNKRISTIVRNGDKQRYNNDQLGKDIEPYLNKVIKMRLPVILEKEKVLECRENFELIEELNALNSLKGLLEIEDARKVCFLLKNFPYYTLDIYPTIFLKDKNTVQKIYSRIHPKQTQKWLTLLQEAEALINKHKNNELLRNINKVYHYDEMLENYLIEFTYPRLRDSNFLEIKKRTEKELEQTKLQWERLEKILEKSNRLKIVPKNFKTRPHVMQKIFYPYQSKLNLPDLYTYLKWENIRLEKELEFLEDHKNEFPSPDNETGKYMIKEENNLQVDYRRLEKDRYKFSQNMDKKITEKLPIYMNKINRGAVWGRIIITEKEYYYEMGEHGVEISLQALENSFIQAEEDALKAGKLPENPDEYFLSKIQGMLREIKEAKIKK